MKKRELFLLSIFALNTGYSIACSPPAPGTEQAYSFDPSTKSRAMFQSNGISSNFILKTTNQAEVSGHPGLCPNGFSVQLIRKNEETSYAKGYNEAIKECSKMFQLYLVSSQSLEFTIMANYGDEGDGRPSCSLGIK